MDSTILIVLIIAVAVVVVLCIFRDKLRTFSLTANKEGIKADLETQPTNIPPTNPVGSSQPPKPPGVTIRGNTQIGTDNKIHVGQNSIDVSDNLQYGQKQTIEVQSEEPEN